MECIVLVGGLGTRLRGVIGAQPKCMAAINGQPFLHYLFRYLAQQQCTRVVLSLGYAHEVILEWLKGQTLPFEVGYVIEEEPLGTGGGIQLALKAAQQDHVMVLNGDTMFMVDLQALLSFHKQQQAATTLALKQLHDFSRYGIVNVDERNCIIAFEEKQYRESGLINGGIYAIDRAALLNLQLPEKFSFEKDYLEQQVSSRALYGYESKGYFIDIGIPEDYSQAQEDFKQLFS
jgi:D-glycero-alpha-D-manno-heptose 1-phosphate guanylyltransferase